MRKERGSDDRAIIGMVVLKTDAVGVEMSAKEYVLRVRLPGVLAVGLCGAALVVSGPSPAIAAENPAIAKTFIILTNDAPKSVTLAPSATDSKIGTESIHEAVVRNAKGAVAGTFHASVLTVGETPGDLLETRLRTVVFNLKDGQINASGVAVYPTDNAYLAVNRPVRIAVVGGTGKYIGARGQMVTTRRDDGTYRHVLTLLK